MRYEDMTTDQKLSALAADIEKCEIAMAFTRSRAAKRKFEAHRRACMAEIDRLAPINPRIAAMSADELLNELCA